MKIKIKFKPNPGYRLIDKVQFKKFPLCKTLIQLNHLCRWVPGVLGG